MIATRFQLVTVKNTVFSDPTELGEEQVQWPPSEGDFVAWGQESYRVLQRSWTPRHPTVDLVVTVIEDAPARKQNRSVRLR